MTSKNTILASWTSFSFDPVSFPFEGLTQYASHLPIMGEKGMDWLMEQKNLYFRNCGI